MATEVDLQRLVVQMEASFVKYQREWSKAMGVTDTNVKRVQQRFDGMTKSINNAGANTARALQPVAGQTSNIAAQFQDIAVQLQGGQSPFLIAMQQGTQLSAVLNQSKSPIAALSAGFMQMVNPISLATIAAIALGGAAAQYLGKLLGEGKSAEDLLKEHNETIRSVAEKWGDAVPALKAYVDQLDRAKDQTSLGQAYDEVVRRQFETLQATLSETRAEFAAARTDLAALGASAQEIDALQSEFETLQKRAEDGSASTADLERMMELLAQTTGATTVPSLVTLQGILGGVSQALATASREASILREEQAKLKEPGAQVIAFNENRKFVAEQERLNGLTADQLNLENEIARVKSEAERSKTLISDQQALEIAQGRLAAEDRRSKLASAERSAGKTENRERDAVLELIAALEHEQTLLGLNAQQKAVANALRQAGAAATDKQREAIVALVNATYEEQAALDLVNDQVREFSDAGRAALSGFIQDVLAGKNATEALGNALANIGNRLINMGLDSLFSGGASGGGLLGGLLKIPGRESGGPVQAGQPYVVGERRPELFVPTQNGVILPRLPNGGGGGGASVTYAPTIDARGADEGAVAKLAQVLARDRAEFEGRVRKIVSRRSKEGW